MDRKKKKGNELTKATYKLLKKRILILLEMLSQRDIPKGEINVLVADGFVGNTALKMYEGSASNILGMIKDEIYSLQ